MNTDLDLDDTVTEADLVDGAAHLLTRVSGEHLRVGVIRDGEVMAVLIDVEDARILERLELAAEEKWAAEREPDDGQRFSLDDLTRDRDA
jgi:hypothetical protein